MERFVAERRILYSLKGSGIRKELIIRLCAPEIVAKNAPNNAVGAECAICRVVIEGIPEPYSDVYGMDTFQAVNMASNVEPFLRRISKIYDLFWLSGEPYFD